MAWNPLLATDSRAPKRKNAAIFGMKAKARGGPRTLMAAQETREFIRKKVEGRVSERSGARPESPHRPPRRGKEEG